MDVVKVEMQRVGVKEEDARDRVIHSDGKLFFTLRLVYQFQTVLFAFNPPSSSLFLVAATSLWSICILHYSSYNL